MCWGLLRVVVWKRTLGIHSLHLSRIWIRCPTYKVRTITPKDDVIVRNGLLILRSLITLLLCFRLHPSQLYCSIRVCIICVVLVYLLFRKSLIISRFYIRKYRLFLIPQRWLRLRSLLLIIVCLLLLYLTHCLIKVWYSVITAGCCCFWSLFTKWKGPVTGLPEA
jgi:hypothetical protein